ncbi:MAG: ComEA family DNA-binding protein [Deltaproteobacteria bacterium]|nr:ComEA family DNA-binding protein [Deltaproteobacteria bacterium]
MKNSKRFLVFLIVIGFVLCLAGGLWAADEGQKINLNTASAVQLTQLKGIGPAIADRIVGDREANGNFKTIDDLVRVKGIGPKVLASIKDQVTAAVPEKTPEPKKK